jgi:hypothetical protein
MQPRPISGELSQSTGKAVTKMSARSLTKLAVKRDKNSPDTQVKAATDVLVATIPSEALTAYTTLIGIVLAANIGSGYGAFRWIAYGAFIALAMLAHSSRTSIT